MPCRPLLLAALLVAQGCAGSDGTVQVRSINSPVVDSPRLTHASYSSSDPNTADVFLTDLDSAQLQPGADFSHTSGRIVQIHMFLEPLAGSTPIADSACSVVVRHIVLADGAIGVYSGGGFMLPASHSGGRTLSGSVRQATLRLTGKSETFADPLGAATLDARFSAPLDEAGARQLASRVNELLLQVKEVAPPIASAEEPKPASAP
jgi:hypothetical protein